MCLNRVSRKTSPTETIDEQQHIDTLSESASDRLLRQERGVQVRRAIATLPPKQRATLILRMYHELSHEEIAGVLGLSRRTVSTHLERLYRRHGFHSRVEVIRLLSNR